MKRMSRISYVVLYPTGSSFSVRLATGKRSWFSVRRALAEDMAYTVIRRS
jgi:hypothetical protein